MTSQPATDCSLSGQPPYNLQGCDLSGRNLFGRDLTNAQLQNAKLLGTIFNGVVSMDGADLTGATMGNGTDFTGCDLSKANFGPKPNFGANALYLTRFVGATIPYRTLGAQWSYLDLTNANLLDLPPDLSELTVTRSNLNGFKFTNRTIRNAQFYGVSLQEADFSGGTLNNVVFGQQDRPDLVCDLTRAKFVGAQIISGKFNAAILTTADFTGATLTGALFTKSRMDGTRFDKTDMSTCSFGGVHATFSTDPKNLTSFRGTRLKLFPIFLSWTCLDLTGATFVDLDECRSTTALVKLQAQYAVLTGLDLSNFDMSECNLTGATLTGVKFIKAKLHNALMYGVKNTCELFRVPQTSSDYQAFHTALQNGAAAGVATIFAKNGHTLVVAKIRTDSSDEWWTVTDASTKAAYSITNVTSADGSCLIVMDLNLASRFDNATLTSAKFSPNNGQPTALRGAIFNGAIMDNADFSQADLGQVNPYDPTTAAQFKGARMNGTGLSQANLTGAKLTGTVYLHNANLAHATLKGADLTGAQLGKLLESFRVPERSDDYKPLLAALRGHDAAGLAPIFKNFGVLITAAQTRVETTVLDRSWTITNISSQDTYTALNWTSSDNTTFLIVSTPTKAATLTGAYMPNATLVDTNLYGVSAAHLQLYGEKARLDGAILDDCKLAFANLGGSTVVVKALCNVDLGYANLINTKFTGADLTDVTLSYASLQGADFTDTKLNDADLTNAMVSVSLTASIAGTYLFSVKPTDTAYSSVLAELQAAAKVSPPVNLANGADEATIEQYIRYLKGGDMARVGPLFQRQGVTFSQSATITPTKDPDAWQIISPTPPGNYTVWHGIDKRGDDTLQALPSMPSLQEVWGRNPTLVGTLRWQATVSQQNLLSNQWHIDNDSLNPKNLQLGYATVLVTKGTDQSLAFYGTTLRIEQLGDDNKLHIDVVSYRPTVLCDTDNQGVQQCGTNGSGSRFGQDTVCPNAGKLRDNQTARPSVPWEQMLRAKQPPEPPKCVPTPYGDCPYLSPATIAAEERRRLGLPTAPWRQLLDAPVGRASGVRPRSG